MSSYLKLTSRAHQECTGLTSLHREEPSTVVRAMSTHAPTGEGPCTEHGQDRRPRPAALPEPRTRHEEAALAPQALAAPAAWGRRTQAGRWRSWRGPAYEDARPARLGGTQARRRPTPSAGGALGSQRPAGQRRPAPWRARISAAVRCSGATRAHQGARAAAPAHAER